ncbi:MAG: hypothetical protein ABR584_12035 [Candidatus Baltobacteraceae bacterium]
MECVENDLAALEAACAEGERAVLEGVSADIDQSIADQRRLSHALQNSMDAARSVRTPEFDERILNRIRHIGMARDRHISIMRQNAEKIQEQIGTLTRWKRASRKWLTGFQEKRTSGLDHMR